MKLIIFRSNFEVGLSVSAGWANFWCFCTNNNVTTVAAFPNLNFAPFKDRSSFDIFEKSTEAFFVVLFNFSNQEEFFSKLRGTLFFGGFGEFNIYICPFVVFTICSSFQVFGSITNAKEFFIPHFGVFFFVVSSLQEKFCDLFKAIFFCS